METLIFGATGAAGGGVLQACLSASDVDEVRVVIRRPLPHISDKLRVFVHDNFLNYAAITKAFVGIDACLYCLGTSATQVSGETEYRRITYDFALAVAEMLKLHSPNAVFHFISGRGASPDSRFMWARVKAETERDLLAQTNTVCWRPAFINGESLAIGPQRPLLHQLVRSFFRFTKPFRHLYVESEDIGRAMLQATAEKLRGRVIENAEIREMANRYQK